MLRFLAITLAIMLTAALSVLPAAARRKAVNKSAGQGQVEWHKVADGSKKGLKCQVTDGYHEISGWEEGIIQRDPNLRHWTWVPMLEAERAYIRVAPGYRPARAGIDDIPQASHYVRPARLRPGTKVCRKGQPRIYSRTPDRIVQTAPTERLYVKPVHVTTVCSPGTKTSLSSPNTNLRLSCQNPSQRLAAPDMSAKLRSPEIEAGLRAPQTGGRPSATAVSARAGLPGLAPQLGAPRVHARAGFPQVNPRLASREAGPRVTRCDLNGQLSSRQVSVRLAAPDTRAQIASTGAYGRLPSEDAFADDSAESGRPDAYRSKSIAATSSANSTVTHVHGQVVPSSAPARYH